MAASRLSAPVAALLRFDYDADKPCGASSSDDALKAAREALLQAQQQHDDHDSASVAQVQYVANLAGHWVANWHGTHPAVSDHLPHRRALSAVFDAVASGPSTPESSFHACLLGHFNHFPCKQQFFLCICFAFEDKFS